VSEVVVRGQDDVFDCLDRHIRVSSVAAMLFVITAITSACVAPTLPPETGQRVLAEPLLETAVPVAPAPGTQPTVVAIDEATARSDACGGTPTPGPTETAYGTSRLLTCAEAVARTRELVNSSIVWERVVTQRVRLADLYAFTKTVVSPPPADSAVVWMVGFRATQPIDSGHLMAWDGNAAAPAYPGATPARANGLREVAIVIDAVSGGIMSFETISPGMISGLHSLDEIRALPPYSGF
jgi:hypothetical protein